MPTKKALQEELDKLGVKYKVLNTVKDLEAMLETAKDALVDSGPDEEELAKIEAAGPGSVLCLHCREIIKADERNCPKCSAENLQLKSNAEKPPAKYNGDDTPCPDCIKAKKICPACKEKNDIQESPEKVCRVCGCTEEDCSQCIEKTGEPCSWVEDDEPGCLCSACVEEKPEPVNITMPNVNYCDNCSALKEIGTLGGHKKCQVYDKVMLPRQDLQLISYGQGSMQRPVQCKEENTAKAKR